MVQHRHSKISGWFNFQDLYKEQVDLAENGSKFVEIGTFMGKSASFMGVEIMNSGKKIRFDTIDTFKGSPAEMQGKHKVFKEKNVYEIAKKNLEGLPVNIIVGDSAEISKMYGDGTLDFVFIDGSHEQGDVLKDIEAWKPKVKIGGTLAGHDYDQKGVRRAVESVFGLDCPCSATSWCIKIGL